MLSGLKYIDRKLYEWSCFVRASNRVDIGFTISSAYGTRVPGISHDKDIYSVIDHAVGSMQEPFRRVVIRHYLDPVPNKRHVYYASWRQNRHKAKTEKMAVSTYNDYLQSGKAMVFNKIDKLK